MITYPYKTCQVKLPGDVVINYIDEGQGERTLLFIHGLANYALSWKKNIDHLRQYYRCIAIDLPGNGLSDRNEHPFGIAFFAETVLEFIKTLQLSNLCIVGHSMGGQVALTMLINRPRCAERLILCAPAGFEEFSLLERSMYYGAMQFIGFLSSDELSLRSTIEKSFYHFPAGANTMIHELVEIIQANSPAYYRKMLEGCVKGLLEEAVYDRLGLVTLPTLVMFGTHDGLIPNRIIHHITTEKLARDAVKLLSDARLIMEPDAGHFLQWEKAAEVNAHIRTFLEGGNTAKS